MINKVTLIGRLGKDPELKTLDGGSKVTKFTLATDESYKDKNGEWQTNTEWHNIILWRDLAESAEKKLKKGDLVYVEGKVTYRSWKDDQNVERNICEIVVSHFRKLKEATEKDATNTTSNSNAKPKDASSNPDEKASDDLPF